MPLKYGDQHHNWKGDQAKYRARHRRVEAARGKASAYQCPCGTRAAEWSLRHDKDGLDLQDYTALCVTCHREYDGVMFPGNGLAGERCWNHVFAADDVEEIRARHGAWGESPTALAREYGVSRGAITGIVHFRNWRHLNACVITTGGG